MASKYYLLVMVIVVVISLEIHCQMSQDLSEEEDASEFSARVPIEHNLFGSGRCPPTQQYDRLRRRCITVLSGGSSLFDKK